MTKKQSVCFSEHCVQAGQNAVLSGC